MGFASFVLYCRVLDRIQAVLRHDESELRINDKWPPHFGGGTCDNYLAKLPTDVTGTTLVQNKR